jgi:hypothetical protein
MVKKKNNLTNDEILDKIVKKPRKNYKNSPVIGDGGITATPSEIKKTMMNMKELYKLPKVKTDKECEERLSWFFDWCIDREIRPTVEAMAMSLGVTRVTLWEWEHGKIGASRANIIKKGKQFVSLILADMAINNKIYPATWIFYGKNYFGMVDQQEHILIPNNPLGDIENPDLIQQRLMESLPEPEEDE